VLMRVLARDGVAKVQSITGPLLAVSFMLVLATHVPHIGVSVNGARRWIGPSQLQFQPSELDEAGACTVRAMLLANRPGRVNDLRDLMKPLLFVVGGGLPAGRHAARSRHGDGDRVHDLCAVDRGGHPDAQPGDHRRRNARAGVAIRAREAVRARAADLVHQPLGACLGQRLSGGAGADRDRLGRAVRAGRDSRCRRSSISPRRRPTSFSR